MSLPSGAAAGILLVIIGIWLLVQTLAAGLVDRILALRTQPTAVASPAITKGTPTGVSTA